jgi:hypothetical protein
MKTTLALLIGCAALAGAAAAAVAPVAVRVPDATAWIGQRVPFFIELRALGPFAGTASFDLPHLAGTVLMKVGNPVVGSHDLDGESWFVQTHEFALFSQKPGPLEVPAIAVRFGSRDGFSGPATDVQAEAPGWTVDIKRPPGSDTIGFLITTPSLDVTETWAPQPGPARVGAMFTRTIVQRAAQVTGMALAPAPSAAPDGIRVYPGPAETTDRLERGEFLGERRETITYLLTQPGSRALPALTYVWWNPTTQRLQSTTLPAVTFDVAPAPATRPVEASVATRRAWPWLLAVAVAVSGGAWQRRRLARWGKRGVNALNPPDRAAARQLRRACRRHDAAAAQTAWDAWRRTQDARFQPGPALHSAVLGLQRHRFGPAPAGTWQGDDLARAFDEHLAAANAPSSRDPAPVLPELNPSH